MKKKKLKNLQPLPKTKLSKRTVSALSVIGISFMTVVSCCPITSHATVSEIDLASAQNALVSEDNIVTVNYSTDYDSKRIVYYNFTQQEEQEEQENISEQSSDFEYFFDDSEDVTAVSVKNQKSELDADSIIKEAEKKKTNTSYTSDSSYTSGSSYISLNSDAVAMSDLSVPDYITFDENGLPENYSYIVEGRASAYCTGSVTATGTVPHQGSVAIDPSVIPYGKMMYIVSLDGSIVYGYCRAEDTGGFVWNGSGRVADLYMNSYSDCMAWGVRGVRIYVF